MAMADITAASAAAKTGRTRVRRFFIGSQCRPVCEPDHADGFFVCEGVKTVTCRCFVWIHLCSPAKLRIEQHMNAITIQRILLECGEARMVLASDCESRPVIGLSCKGDGEPVFVQIDRVTM